MNLYIQTLLLFLLSLTLSAQDDADIRLVLTKQQNAWNEGDIDGFMDHYWKSDSLRFMTKEKVTRGWKNTLERYKKGYPDKQTMGKLDFDILSVEQLANDAAIVTGHWKVTAGSEVSEGHFNLLFRKKQNRWVIVLDHTS